MFVYILLGGICQQSKNRISIPFCNVVYFLHYSFLIKKMWAVFLGQKCIVIGPLVIRPYLTFWVEWKGSPLPKQSKHFLSTQTLLTICIVLCIWSMFCAKFCLFFRKDMKECWQKKCGQSFTVVLWWIGWKYIVLEHDFWQLNTNWICNVTTSVYKYRI